MRIFAILLIGCLAGYAGADEPAIVGPDQVEAGDLAIFRVTDAPKAGRWAIWPAEAEPFFLPVLLPDGSSAAVFASRQSLRFVVVYAAASSSDTVLLLHGCANGKGPEPQPPDPGPEPPPPPPPPPKREQCDLVIIEESSQRTVQQARLYTDATLRQTLAGRGHRLFVFDKDVTDPYGNVPANLVGYLNAAKGKTLPVLICAARTKEGKAKIVFAQSLDGTMKQLVMLLRRADPEFPDIPEPTTKQRVQRRQVLVPACPSGVCPTPQWYPVW